MYKLPYEKRDSICVSHYPVPTSPPIPEDLPSLMELSRTEEKEIALYIHVPFCDVLCGFCPFNKETRASKAVERYLAALEGEAALYAKTPYAKSFRVRSLNMGGGTPTSLTLPELERIFNIISGAFHFAPDPMIFVEGNPKNFTMEKLTGLRKRGLNRISVGVQTFSETASGRLGLYHTVEDSRRVIKNGHEAGVQNVGIDLMYNTPGQTMEEWRKDLQEAVRLGVDHICIIAFCVVPGKPLAAKIKEGRLADVGGVETEIAFYREARDYLRGVGYIQYSVIDFALPGKEDLHAQMYFGEQSDLLGLGPAAFGYLNGYMYINHGELSVYEEAVGKGLPPVFRGEKARAGEPARGAMAKGLRMLRVSRRAFKARYGGDPVEMFRETVERLTEKGLLQVDDETVSLTSEGEIWGNDVCKEFFSDQYRGCGVAERVELASGRAAKGDAQK